MPNYKKIALLTLLTLGSLAQAYACTIDFVDSGEKSLKGICLNEVSFGYDNVNKTSSVAHYKLSPRVMHEEVVNRGDYKAIDGVEIQNQYSIEQYKNSEFDLVTLVSPMYMNRNRLPFESTMLNMVNIFPLHKDLWRGSFGKLLNRFVRLDKELALSKGSLDVYTGVIYLKAPNKISQPDFLYKIYRNPTYNQTISFLVPFDDTPQEIESYITTIDCIEEVAGFDLQLIPRHSKLDDMENGLAIDSSVWSVFDGNSKVATCG